LKLVDNAVGVWRHYSTGALLAVGAIQGVWTAMPQAWINVLPAWATQAMAYTTMAIATWGVIGKFIKQDLPSDTKEDTPK
jgi:hypothetical protein